ncbi:heterokaryon incompatibility protein-domain-containing protein [Ganoderma leucocontextum]|nr:heterokaryon incompatibility protein-domain-containing protein [Ganoderma leucocontextum]
MRLLNTTVGEFHWIDSPLDKPYAILSHTWDGAEQSHHNVVNIRTTLEARSTLDILPKSHSIDRETDTPTVRVSILSSPDVSEKVRRACAVARADGYELIWIDSCCIDKSSSAELSEAINSMYNWYRHAKVCYVYLSDVDDDDLPSAPNSQFRSARWHTRGWTLQELLAPRYVVFYSKGWRVLGTKNTLATVVEEVTGIDRAILNHELPLQSVSVARRMWWSSARVTARVEDEAYCLMGIFDINMPTIYGEGRHAFVRLQEEILKVVPDQSIFSWALRIDGNAASRYASGRTTAQIRSCSGCVTEPQKQTWTRTTGR